MTIVWVVIGAACGLCVVVSWSVLNYDDREGLEDDDV